MDSLPDQAKYGSGEDPEDEWGPHPAEEPRHVAVVIKDISFKDNYNIGERHVYRFTSKPRVIIPSARSLDFD